METLDLRKQYKNLYNPSARIVELVQVPRLNFILLDGQIEPGYGPGTSPEFQAAMEAMYGISYTLKFMLKLRKNNPVDYPVMALEGLWGMPGFDRATFDITNPSGWQYTLMMMQPDFITPDLFQEGLAQLKKKRGSQPAFDRLRLESFEEGWAIQIMHIGPYATEMATIARMDAYAEANGYQMVGRHHEIYLGDPRRTAPEKLKTVLRHPVAKV
ncbi:MAG: GyrI-like domain-containing protein [Anaerolineales bacterium]|jgi:hypothetical protein|nr:GyrI-like domain-containing protein [Anaerolineales bacterium]